MNLCIICLRTDRILKVASNLLEEFHDELCDYSVVTTAPSCFYCNECWYLLMKFYKFKEKCLEALKIYKKWKTSRGSKKQPLNHLYSLLPPSPLGMWTSNAKISHITLQSTDSQTDLCDEDELVKEKYIEVKFENDHNYSENINKCAVDLKTEDNSENVSESEHNDSETEKYLPIEKVEKLLKDNSDESTGSKAETSKIRAKLRRKKPLKKITPKRKLNYDKVKESDSETEKYLHYEKLEEDDSDENTGSKAENSEIRAELKRKMPCTKITPKRKLNYDKVKESDSETEKYLHFEKLEDDSDEDTELNVTKAENSEKVITKLGPKKPNKKINPKNVTYEEAQENDKQYKSVFDIEYLTTPKLKLEEFKRRKTYECYVKAEHKCEICYQVFKSSKFLEYHTNKWHNESPGSVLCRICNTWNSTHSRHSLTHVVVFKCKLCPLVTSRRCSMQKHFEWHKGKEYNCEECKITYKSKSSYYAHMGKAHRRGRNVCEGCGRGFLSPLGLKIHKSSSTQCTVATEPSTLPTEPTEGVRCDECDVTLPSQEVYDAHVFDVHEPPRGIGRPLTINSDGLPGYRVLKTREMKSHKLQGIRRSNVKHTCLVCKAAGPSFGWLQRHFKNEHPDDDFDVLYAGKRTHLCDICGTGFSNIYHLRDHMNVHTGARPYPCDLCPKLFRSALQRREHRLRHFPASIPCPHCGKLVRTPSNLYNHMKTHTGGDRNHKCDICGKAFLQLCNLKEHVRGVHHNIRRVRGAGGAWGGARKGGEGAGAELNKSKTEPETEESIYVIVNEQPSD